MIEVLLPLVDMLLNKPLEMMVTLIHISSGYRICALTGLRDHEAFPGMHSVTVNRCRLNEGKNNLVNNGFPFLRARSSSSQNADYSREL